MYVPFTCSGDCCRLSRVRYTEGVTDREVAGKWLAEVTENESTKNMDISPKMHARSSPVRWRAEGKI